jgi:hypothetical protein
MEMLDSPNIHREASGATEDLTTTPDGAKTKGDRVLLKVRSHADLQHYHL